MQWEQGRQAATQSLRKLTLWSFWRTDGYILNIPQDSIIEWHKDEVSGKRHLRFNFTLKGFWILGRKGKEAKSQGPCCFHLFRPDITEHMAVIKKNTYILSIGFVI